MATKACLQATKRKWSTSTRAVQKISAERRINPRPYLRKTSDNIPVRRVVSREFAIAQACSCCEPILADARRLSW